MPGPIDNRVAAMTFLEEYRRLSLCNALLPCQHGHFNCSTTDRGPCVDEVQQNFPELDYFNPEAAVEAQVRRRYRMEHGEIEEGAEQPSPSQLEALRAYAFTNGREWKSKLVADWMNGKTEGELQQVRNQFGPSWLKSYKLNGRGNE